MEKAAKKLYLISARKQNAKTILKEYKSIFCQNPRSEDSERGLFNSL